MILSYTINIFLIYRVHFSNLTTLHIRNVRKTFQVIFHGMKVTFKKQCSQKFFFWHFNEDRYHLRILFNPPWTNLAFVIECSLMYFRCYRRIILFLCFQLRPARLSKSDSWGDTGTLGKNSLKIYFLIF